MTLTLEDSTFFRKSFAWSDDHDFTHGCVSKIPSKESSEIENEIGLCTSDYELQKLKISNS